MSAPEDEPKKKKGRLKELIAEYGFLAIVTWILIAAVTYLGLLGAIFLFGFEVEGVASGVGIYGAAYVGLQASKLIRIAATAGLTPIVARYYHRVFPKSEEDEEDDEEDEEDDGEDDEEDEESASSSSDADD